MPETNAEAIKLETKKYITIFAILLSGSLMTVGISYLHLSLPVSVFFALAIAAVQVFFAAGYFMHLISEKRVVLYITLAFTVVFAIGLLVLPTFENHNPIFGTVHHQAHTTAEDHDVH